MEKFENQFRFDKSYRQFNGGNFFETQCSNNFTSERHLCAADF